MIERGDDTRKRMESTDGFKYPYQVYYIQVCIRLVEGFSKEEKRYLKANIHNKAVKALKEIYTDGNFALLYTKDLLEKGVQEFYIAGSCDWLIVKDERELIKAISRSVGAYATVTYARGKKLLPCTSYQQCKKVVDIVNEATAMFGSSTIH